MAYRPQLKRCFCWTLIPSEGVILQSEQEQFTLRGAMYAALVPLLNGQQDVDEIVSRCDGQFSPVEVLYALKLLHQQGYLADAAPAVSVEQAAFWDLLGVDPRIAIRRLQETTVSVISFVPIDLSPLLDLLAALGVPVADDGQQCLVLTDDYLRPELEGLNQKALAHGRPWILMKPIGAEIWIGPLFMPGKTGCWECLAHRLRGARKLEHYLEEKTLVSRSFSPSVAVLPSTLHTAFGIIATEVVKWLSQGHHEQLEGRVVTLNTLTLAKEDHILVRRPQCRECGNPTLLAAQQSSPVVLQRQRKLFTADGGHRCFTPDETWQELRRHISPITGIVGALYPAAAWVGEDSVAPSFLARQNFPHLPREDSWSLEALSHGLRSGSGGKGRQPLQAKVSALCEAIERYSGTFQGDEARLRARWSDLSAVAVHPNACMLYSEQQFSKREEWNACGIRATWVPEPFHPQMEIEWSPAWSLTYNEQRYVPTAYCYYGYSRKYRTWFARADSNGCAAGRTKEEAILQGFMELVERDCIALWWYNCLQKPAVDLSSFADPYFLELQTYYNSLHRDLWVLDLTNDLRIPTFAAVSRRTDKEVEDMIVGFGSHFDARLAIQRSLTEMNQWLPIAHPLGKEDAYFYRDPESARWWRTISLATQPQLTPDTARRRRLRTDYAEDWNEDLSDDVRKCTRLAEACGLETLILDQTRPDTGLYVVKVLVPGLRHFWPRFGAGRLYNIPVRMEWIKDARTEEQLNRQYIFF